MKVELPESSRRVLKKFSKNLGRRLCCEMFQKP
jgi:hypothetical protein